LISQSEFETHRRVFSRFTPPVTQKGNKNAPEVSNAHKNGTNVTPVTRCRFHITIIVPNPNPKNSYLVLKLSHCVVSKGGVLV